MPEPQSTPRGDRNPVIVWFRNDLRLGDNPALTRAATTGRPVIPLFILDEAAPGVRPLGGAARWWLHQSLLALDQSLCALEPGASQGLPLCLRRGATLEVLRALIAASGASCVFCNRTSDPALERLDGIVAEALDAHGIAFDRGPGTLLAEPDTFLTGNSGPFRVFTAFWNRLATRDVPRPLPPPRRLIGYTPSVSSDRLEDWALLPDRSWDSGFSSRWKPGERGARERLVAFLNLPLKHYPHVRDLPAVEGTSRLSPHLHFGEISVREVWHALQPSHSGHPGAATGNAFLRELGWREFAAHTLYHYPTLPEHPLRPEYVRFGWLEDPPGFKAWCRGQTGYPIVDAGMRELWHTGWMHNRVRMITSSFLVKDLLITWQRGETWFWDTLVDADRASNALNWQWVSGSGVDAAPYFRIFNPVTQSRRFDPEAGYLRRWLPELRALPTPAIHAPWTAQPEVLARAGVRLGETYPWPIVEHDAARRRALARFHALRRPLNVRTPEPGD